MSEFYIGLMSGTSVDAIDAVLMDFAITNTHIVTSFSQAIDKELKKQINRVIAKQTWPQNIEDIDIEFANASAQAVQNLLSQASIKANQIQAIGSHGQTIFHDPNGTPPVSVQIGNPQLIANKTGTLTIGNFRQADIEAGGQGAPLACAYHNEVFRSTDEDRIVLNLGGIANITKLPKNKNADIIGFDTGPANTLLDAWINKHQGLSFDNDGVWAKSGTINQGLLNLMLKDEYFKQPPPKSTGREKFNLTWLQYILGQYQEPVSKEDVQATLLDLTTKTITNAIKNWAPQTNRILICGGGSYNTYLVSQLQSKLQEVPVEASSKYGVPEKWMEAMAFAWLAKQKIKGNPGNIPSVTGATKNVMLGDLYKSTNTDSRQLFSQ